MKLESINFVYSKKNNKFEYDLLRKHGGIRVNEEFILISQKEFNEVLKLEEYLFRDNYRSIVTSWAKENYDYDNLYELSFLVNDLLDNKDKLKYIISKQSDYNDSFKSSICSFLKEDNFDKPKFYNIDNLKQRNYNYNQQMRQLYKTHKKKK